MGSGAACRGLGFFSLLEGLWLLERGVWDRTGFLVIQVMEVQLAYHCRCVIGLYHLLLHSTFWQQELVGLALVLSAVFFTSKQHQDFHMEIHWRTIVIDLCCKMSICFIFSTYSIYYG